MYSRQQESITYQFHSRLEAVFNHIWIFFLVFWPLIHFVFCRGSFRACCILWGVPVVEDGVATYMSIFDQPVNSEMGCSLIDICSISVPLLPNSIVKPFIIWWVNRKENIQHQKTPISTKVPTASSRQTCQKVRFCLFVEFIWKKTPRDWTKNCNNISKQVVLMISYPPPPNLRIKMTVVVPHMSPFFRILLRTCIKLTLTHFEQERLETKD